MSEATLAGQSVHETIVETMDDVAFAVDADLELVYANEQSRRYVEMPDDDEDASILTLTEEVFATPQEHERFETALKTVLSEDADDAHEFPLTLELELAVDGRRLVEEVRLTPIREDGAVVGAVGVARDVTEQVRQADELRDTQQLLERLYRTSAEPRPFEDRLADILSFGAEYMGVEQGFLTRIEDGTQDIVVGVGENEQLQSGASAPFSESYCRHTLDSEETPLTVLEASEEGWNDDPAFERFGLECYVGSPVTVDGDPYGTLCFADRETADREFTETQQTFVDLLTQWVGYELDRRERERELERERDRSTALFETAPYPFVHVQYDDGDPLVEQANDTFEETFGYDSEAIVGDSLDEMLVPDGHDESAVDINEQLRADEAIRREVVRETAGGERRHFLLRAVPFERDTEGPETVTAYIDITDRKERERELEQFAYVASHDLREPLRVVSNYLQLLERRHGDQFDEDAQEYVDFAVDAAERMKALIDGLLTYSRVNRRGEAFEPTDMAAVVADARSNLEIAIEQSEAEITVPRDLPTVRGDRNQLVTVVQNLLDNALTYAGDSPPNIDISIEERERVWVVTVSDDGVGMNPEQADRAFELFERLGADEEGTGLGLALCRKVVDRHGGTIWLDTAPGEGTDVHFTIPRTE